MQTKFSQTVMVFRCVSREGDVTPLHFFREGLRLNSDAYLELLITVVKPWITMVDHVYGSRILLPATTGKSKKWLLTNFSVYTSPNVWPPNSPDLNPMDYYVWGAVEKDTNCCASTTKAQLID